MESSTPHLVIFLRLSPLPVALGMVVSGAECGVVFGNRDERTREVGPSLCSLLDSALAPRQRVTQHDLSRTGMSSRNAGDRKYFASDISCLVSLPPKMTLSSMDITPREKKYRLDSPPYRFFGTTLLVDIREARGPGFTIEVRRRVRVSWAHPFPGKSPLP
jgi:hypothetical protein